MICGEKCLFFQLFRKCYKRTQREDIENKALKPCLAFEYYLAIERILFYFVLFHVAKNRASRTKHGRLNEVLIHWKSKGEVFNANFASAVSEKSERASVASGLFS